MTTPTLSSHPLDPLSAQELSRAVGILRESGRLGADARFSCALPVEPSKAAVRAHAPGKPFERKLRLVGYDPGLGGSFDARLSLTRGKLDGFERIEKGQAPVSATDVYKALKTVKADSDWQAAMRRRGIEDFSLVQIDPWVTGGFEPEGAEPGARILRCISFLRTHPKDNGYACARSRE